jgi:hypothetical protein
VSWYAGHEAPFRSRMPRRAVAASAARARWQAGM